MAVCGRELEGTGPEPLEEFLTATGGEGLDRLDEGIEIDDISTGGVRLLCHDGLPFLWSVVLNSRGSPRSSGRWGSATAPALCGYVRDRRHRARSSPRACGGGEPLRRDLQRSILRRSAGALPGLDVIQKGIGADQDPLPLHPLEKLREETGHGPSRKHRSVTVAKSWRRGCRAETLLRISSPLEYGASIIAKPRREKTTFLIPEVGGVVGRVG